MTTRHPPFFSTPEPALEETVHFGKPEDRARELENIRLEYTKSRETDRLPRKTDKVSDLASSSPEPEKTPNPASYDALLENALRELDKPDLNHLLNLVLTELRSRESDQIKADVITHSKRLSFKLPLEETPSPAEMDIAADI
jgi:hypothetical protein